jgi:uncharacterized protein YqeY
MSDASILDRVQADMAAAMKAKDAATLSTLRMLKAALMEARTKKPKDATEEEIEVLQRYAKKRRETIEELKRIHRPDLVPREEQEIAVTQRYLPQMMGESELAALVREAIAKTGAAGPKDAGKVIGAVMAQVRGKAEGGTVSRLVREALGG